jgi:hypothetical protein
METNDISNQILNDIEREKVMAFASDPILFQAVKKYVLAVVYQHGAFKPGEDFKGNVNYALQLVWPATEPNGMPRTDQELGQALRALTYATKLVESGFREITDMKEVETLEEDEINPSE